MRRTFIALAAAATIGVPALYSGGAQAQPATTGSMNGNGHTQALNATRGVLAPTSPMLEIHWAVNDDQKPPTPDGPNDPNPPTPRPSEPGEPEIPAPDPGPTTPPAPENPPTPDDPNPGTPGQPPTPGNPDPTPGNPDPTPDPGAPTPDDPAQPSPGPTTPAPDPGPTTPNPGPTTPAPEPTTPPAPGANPTNPPAPTPGRTPSKHGIHPSKPGIQYRAADRGTPPLPAGQVPSALPPAPTGIGDISAVVGGGAPGPEDAQAPAPSVNTQRPSASELAQTGAGSSALTSAAFGATGLALLAMRRRARKRSRA